MRSFVYKFACRFLNFATNLRCSEYFSEKLIEIDNKSLTFAVVDMMFDLQSWTEVVVTPTPSPRIQCCHVESQFNIDLGGAACYNIFVQDCLRLNFFYLASIRINQMYISLRQE